MIWKSYFLLTQDPRPRDDFFQNSARKDTSILASYFPFKLFLLTRTDFMKFYASSFPIAITLSVREQQRAFICDSNSWQLICLSHRASTKEISSLSVRGETSLLSESNLMFSGFKVAFVRSGVTEKSGAAKSVFYACSHFFTPSELKHKDCEQIALAVLQSHLNFWKAPFQRKIVHQSRLIRRRWHQAWRHFKPGGQKTKSLLPDSHVGSCNYCNNETVLSIIAVFRK